MSEAWDTKNVLEAEANKILAEAELNKSSIAYVEAAATELDKRREVSAQRAACAATRAISKAWLTVVGRSVVVHAIWASATCFVVWTIVVYGWRG